MFERLIKLVRQEDVTLFIGAGFSLEAGTPSVCMLRETIFNEMPEEKRKEHKNDGLDKLSDYYVEKECLGSRSSLVQLLKKKFEIRPNNLNDHLALTNIPHFHYILTTNYDTLLEDTYPESYRQVVRNDNDCSTMLKKPVTIFKIHGDFTDSNSVVITSQDYKNFFEHRRNPEMWKLVESEFLTKHICFIGYSLEDDNILDIINNISEAVGKNQKDMFLIAPNLTEEKKKKLQDMHVHYFDAKADLFLNELDKDLKKNITRDYEQHMINAETYSRYLHLHNIDPSVSPKDKKDNEVTSIKSLDGQPLTQNLLITIDEDTKKMLEERDFEKMEMFIQILHFLIFHVYD